MKYGIGLGLMVGIVSAMFFPYIFMLINDLNAFAELAGVYSRLALIEMITPGFSGTFANGYDGNLFYLFTKDIFPQILIFLAAFLAWFVSGILAGLFTQSTKRGVLAGLVFFIVAVLLYMLMEVLSGTQDLLGTVVGIYDITGILLMEFLPRIIITPFLGIIAGSTIGGKLSLYIFGPEQFT